MDRQRQCVIQRLLQQEARNVEHRMEDDEAVAESMLYLIAAAPGEVRAYARQHCYACLSAQKLVRSSGKASKGRCRPPVRNWCTLVCVCMCLCSVPLPLPSAPSQVNHAVQLAKVWAKYLFQQKRFPRSTKAPLSGVHLNKTMRGSRQCPAMVGSGPASPKPGGGLVG